MSGRLILLIVLLAVLAAFLIGIAIATLGPSGVGDSNSALPGSFALPSSATTGDGQVRSSTS